MFQVWFHEISPTSSWAFFANGMFYGCFGVWVSSYVFELPQKSTIEIHRRIQDEGYIMKTEKGL